MIVIHAAIPLAAEQRERGIEIALELAEESREEPGTIEYQVGTDLEDPNLLRFFEQYEDIAAFEAHAESDHFQAFEAELPDLLGGEPTVLQFEVDTARELDV